MASKSKQSSERVTYQEFGAVQRPDAPEREDLSPNQQTLILQASRKGRKGKTVTVISGFQLTEKSLQTLAKKLKSQCGSGGTVKDETIEIQGDHRTKLQTFLQGIGYKTKISGGG